MSDQSHIDKIIERYLHFWTVFLAACGRLWDKVRTYAGNTGVFLCRCADWIADTVEKGCNVVSAWVKRVLGRLAAWLLRTRRWVMRRVKPALQKIAAWLLRVREKLHPVIRKVGGWFVAAAAWFAAQIVKVRNALPKPRELPPAGEPEQAVIEAADPVPALPAAAESVIDEAEEEESKPRKSRITDPTLRKIFDVLGIIGKYVKLVIKWIWKLRTVFMAIPVVWAAVKLAMENMDRLPDRVGLDIQSTGEFAHMITRTEAVYWPLGITAFCLVLMFCSKKPLLPWVISIFTLVLPILIWVLNYYA